MQTIAILHPGAMGSALARQLQSPRRRLLCCLDGRSDETRHRAHEAGIVPVSLEKLAAESHIALSVVAPTAAYQIAEDLVAAGFSGLLIEANAIRPQRVHAIAEHLSTTGGKVIDACIMGLPPVSPRSDPTRIYLAGPDHLEEIAALFSESPTLQVTTLGTDIGRASKLKLAHSIVQKAAQALALLGHALVEKDGLSPYLASEAGKWPSPASRPERFPSVANRAWRWGDELRDVADELRQADLPPELAEAAASVFDALSGFKDSQSDGEDTYQALRRSPDVQRHVHR
ncbi:DUF1932 domain-containing protein [Spongiactinospora rosea]|uniref:DUF1932 domain-containing protein n=1 Tax=Spongiactinospora rosea TaxID=2248750 RepID=UPI0011C05136|nr:NAD(P)-dependent oxidoreductase [Spongiactinospora rosea]